MEKPSSNHSNSVAIEIPDLVLGSIKNFRNFDPGRILDFQFHDGKLFIFMSEADRLESIVEFRSTIEGFLYEVERAVQPEVEAYDTFRFDYDFTELSFTVDRPLFERDISAEMIECSLVEDALKYQLYSRKPIGVTVYYKDAATEDVFLTRRFPQKKLIFFRNEGDCMRRWGLFIVLFVVSACSTEHTLMEIEEDAYVEVTIPSHVAEQYGTLQLEKKLQYVERVNNQDGSVTVLLKAQEAEQLEQDVKALFTQYEQAIAQKASDQITAFSYDTHYKNIHFYVEDEAVIHEENFSLTEEMLMKQALTYQLIHGETLGIAVLYYDEVGAQVLSKKTIPAQGQVQ